jgi:hypothetical protein
VGNSKKTKALLGQSWLLLVASADTSGSSSLQWFWLKWAGASLRMASHTLRCHQSTLDTFARTLQTRVSSLIVLQKHQRLYPIRFFQLFVTAHNTLMSRLTLKNIQQTSTTCTQSMVSIANQSVQLFSLEWSCLLDLPLLAYLCLDSVICWVENLFSASAWPCKLQRSSSVLLWPNWNTYTSVASFSESASLEECHADSC